MSTFAERLNGARLLRKIRSRAELGRLIGASRATVAAWEKGTQFLNDANLLIKLSVVLRVSPRWLLLGEGRPETGAELSDLEFEMLEAFRPLNPTEQRVLLATARNLRNT